VILFLVVLSIVFGGFAFHFLRMLGGEQNRRPENPALIPSEYIPMGIAALCVFFFGARIPHAFGVLLQEAMAVLR
jgi:hypothetical protein